MAMQKREKILTIITAVLLAAVGLPLLLSGSGGTLGQLRASRDKLRADVERQQTQLRGLERGAEQLAQWRKRSLPSDRKTASRLYQAWLRKLVSDAGLEDAGVDPTEPVSERGAFWKLRFTITGRGTLAQLVRLLYPFYSADCLHQVRRLTITPGEEGEKLTLFLLIEALCLPEAEHQDQLPPGRSQRLAKGSLEAYLAAIVRRPMEGDRTVDSGGLFAAYRPAPPPRVNTPPPPPPPRPPSFDLTKYTVVSGITHVDGRPEVWLDVRPTGQLLKRHEGESFQIGEATGLIEQIGLVSVVLQIHGQRRTIKLGRTLEEASQSSPLEQPAAASPSPPASDAAEATAVPPASPAPQPGTPPPPSGAVAAEKPTALELQTAGLITQPSAAAPLAPPSADPPVNAPAAGSQEDSPADDRPEAPPEATSPQPSRPPAGRANPTGAEP